MKVGLRVINVQTWVRMPVLAISTVLLLLPFVVVVLQFSLPVVPVGFLVLGLLVGVRFLYRPFIVAVVLGLKGVLVIVAFSIGEVVVVAF